ncbi:MAG: hypothetical protein VX955_13200, partial [Pseudomonadota bacterium]|nr:hypothetical protein [Pseudomonadota bacterium]
AEWLCSGLQLRVRRFDSDSSLHFFSASNLRDLVASLVTGTLPFKRLPDSLTGCRWPGWRNW